MVTAPNPTLKLASGSFLRGEQSVNGIFTPEDRTKVHKRIALLADTFVQSAIIPSLEAIEQRDMGLMRRLIQNACAAGIGNVDIAARFGGSMEGIGASVIVAEHLSLSESFNASFAAHTGMGTLPIAYFGSKEQKEKYLPKLATGAWIAAFALSESASGSDALSAATSAVLSADGTEWILNGEKAWVTNGGFADVFIVFANVDPGQFSAFIVDRTSPGLQIGEEEKKMSARGSSTCSLIMSHCRVPRGNLLGVMGQGHVVAFNTLNISRLKLGAASLGSARHSLQSAVAHVRQRKAFSKTLAEFGCIKEKIAQMAAGIYCGESMLYRTTGLLEDALAEIDGDSPKSGELIAGVLEECAAECSIVKIWGSELQQYVVDETLQIFGGSGFIEKHPAERAYRDARLSRICQGTNEINRLIVAVWIVKRAMKGELRLGYLMKKVADEVMTGAKRPEPIDGAMAVERELVENARKATLMVAGVIWQKYGMAMVDQQEIISALADMLIENCS